MTLHRPNLHSLRSTNAFGHKHKKQFSIHLTFFCPQIKQIKQIFYLLKMFFRFISFEGFYSKSCGVWGKNYPKACLRGVFNNKVRDARSAKPSKGFCMFLSNIKDRGEIYSNSAGNQSRRTNRVNVPVRRSY